MCSSVLYNDEPKIKSRKKSRKDKTMMNYDL